MKGERYSDRSGNYRDHPNSDQGEYLGKPASECRYPPGTLVVANGVTTDLGDYDGQPDPYEDR